MTNRRTVDFVLEPRELLYRRLLEASLPKAKHFLLAVQDDLDGPQVQAAIAALAPFAVERRRQSEWPGTRLLHAEASVHRFQFKLQAVEILGRMTAGLFDWIEPLLPEDLCLLRDDDSPWLATIAHERDAWMQIDDEELRELLAVLPELRVCLK